MRQKFRRAFALMWALTAFIFPGKVFAQAGPAPVQMVAFSHGQLDQMLAPIALYPDSLLAQILLAATYPNQIMEANQWVSDHEGLKGPALDRALEAFTWDLSIKALVPFPQVLDMMAREPEWTRELGQAFLAQQVEVMESIQRLRRRARAAGHLRTSVEQRVVVRQRCIEILPTNPQVVYVPCYNPVVVYGAWQWAAYPPLTYYPIWPGVAVAPVATVFGFWGSVTVGPVWGWGWGSWGWGSNNIYLNANRFADINTFNAAGFGGGFATVSMQQALVSGRFGDGSPTWSAARASYMRYGGARNWGHGGHLGRGLGRGGRGGFRRAFGHYHGRAGGFHGRRFGTSSFRSAKLRGGHGSWGGRGRHAGRFGNGKKGAGRSGRFFGGRKGGFGGHGRGGSFGFKHGSFARKGGFGHGGKGFGGFGRGGRKH